MDDNTKQVIGHIMDISPTGLMMDSKVPVPTNLKYSLNLDLMEEIAGKATVEFEAITKWCQPDPIQPYLYVAGFQITNITSDDIEVIKRIADKYGAG